MALSGANARVAPGQHRLESLQWFRGLAACCVLGYHGLLAVRGFSGDPVPDNALTQALSFGHFGVDFFFLLSGFIILHSHFDDPREAGMAARYAAKRLLRVYPPYLPVALAMWAVYTYWPALSAGSHGASSTGPQLWSSLLLLPSERPPALAVAWTLVHEVLFYAIFAAFYVHHRLLILLVVAWVGGIVLAPCWWQPEEVGAAMRVLLSPVNLQFVAGMGCAWIWRRMQASRRLGWLLLVGSMMLLVVLTLSWASLHPELLAIPFAGIVLGGACLDSTRFGVRRLPGSWLGDASYALYLVHGPTLSVAVRLVRAAAPGSAWWAMLVAACVGALAAGWAYHRWVERPMQLTARRLVRP